MVLDILLPFVGGLGMFIYGMQIMAQGLENAAGNKMKNLLEALTKNKFLGVLLGAFITAVIQSSSAVTVMVVGFVNAGIMNLTQAMGVIMGANVGTTITGWLVASSEWAKYITPTSLAPLSIFIGVIIMLTGKRFYVKEAANIIIGFGLLFLGISLMSNAVAPLKESEAFCNIFAVLGHNPLFGILAGAVVTAVIQSSSASVGILQSLAAAGLVPFSSALYIIMGQNIGTCATAILSGLGANKNAKTASIMHLLFNVIGTIIFTICSFLYLNIANPIWASGAITQTQISIIHTVFNIVTTVLLFPASDLIIKLAVKISGGKNTDRKDTDILLDERMLETPAIAIQSVKSEVIRIGGIVENSLICAGEAIFNNDKSLIDTIKSHEDTVDDLTASVSDFAVKLSSLNISERERLEVNTMLKALSDMERISDQCENISEYLTTLYNTDKCFSEEAKADLREMAKICIESYIHAFKAYAEENTESISKCIEKETNADRLESILRSNNISRMTSHHCDAEITAVFQDLLVSLERISDHSRNIAEDVLATKAI